MAQVICKAIAQTKLVPRSHIAFVQRDPARMKAHEQEFGVTAASLATVVESSQLILLCVRPAQANEVLQELARLGVKDKMIASVIAGIKMAHYQKYLGSQAQILRVMPNIASEVGEGMSLFTFTPSASREFRSLAHLLFSSMGEVAEIEENLMDIGTGLSGSGPGFVFRLIEAMARAGVKHGLPYETALKMSAQTFAGAARLILKGKIPAELIRQIATPNGTTEAGFKVMTDVQIEKHFEAVVGAAAHRSQQLST
jgi:pyrroline-5-carboxylate reductase